MSHDLRDLLLNLKFDTWRQENAFSADMEKVHDIVLHPFASDRDRCDAVRKWFQRWQLCVFGRIAAAQDGIHFCILTDEDLYKSDEEIRRRIDSERVLWKQRCLNREKPRAGFLLWAISSRLALAAPDDTLYRFSQKLRDLYVTQVDSDLKGNDIAWETLYLSDPNREGMALRFRFSLDFFGAQGDGRWWHDHRIPGGIAYTANSVGYMINVRELYEKKPDQMEWALKVAMETVDESIQTQWGKAISLRDLNGGEPFKPLVCPFNDSNLKPRLKGKDWTSYEGSISTDHSLRKELFRIEPEPSLDRVNWNMDFAYIYSENDSAHASFVAGEPVSLQDVYSEIGHPSHRRILGSNEKERSGIFEIQLEAMEKDWLSGQDNF